MGMTARRTVTAASELIVRQARCEVASGKDSAFIKFSRCFPGARRASCNETIDLTINMTELAATLA